jgi:hypothetical protein
VNEIVAAAFVAAVASVIVALLQRTRKENSADHMIVMDLLRGIGRKVDKVDDKIDRHVEWHIDKEA